MKIKSKTKKAAAKRFKFTSSGKLMRRGGYFSHLKQKKSKSRIRRHKEPTPVSAGDKKRLIKILK